MSIQAQPQLKLINEWKQYLRSCAEGDKHYTEGHKLQVEAGKLSAKGHEFNTKGNKLFAEGNKLYAEGSKLRAEAIIAWYDAIIETYGENVTVEWKMRKGEFNCLLSNGDVYTAEMGR